MEDIVFNDSLRRTHCSACMKKIYDEPKQMNSSDVEYCITVSVGNGSDQEYDAIVKNEMSLTIQHPRVFCSPTCMGNYFKKIGELMIEKHKVGSRKT